MRKEEVPMDRKLHLLESFTATGTDGRTYKVFAYEHMVRDESLPGVFDHWEPTGVSEYRLADGRHVDLQADGSIRIDPAAR
jgi:hypothetical protein